MATTVWGLGFRVITNIMVPYSFAIKHMDQQASDSCVLLAPGTKPALDE